MISTLQQVRRNKEGERPERIHGERAHTAGWARGGRAVRGEQRSQVQSTAFTPIIRLSISDTAHRLTFDTVNANKLQTNERLATVEQDAIARSKDPERSPSPPPRYDANGIRTNNRNVRMRDGLNKERSELWLGPFRAISLPMMTIEE